MIYSKMLGVSASKGRKEATPRTFETIGSARLEMGTHNDGFYLWVTIDA